MRRQRMGRLNSSTSASRSSTVPPTRASPASSLRSGTMRAVMCDRSRGMLECTSRPARLTTGTSRFQSPRRNMRSPCVSNAQQGGRPGRWHCGGANRTRRRRLTGSTRRSPYLALHKTCDERRARKNDDIGWLRDHPRSRATRRRKRPAYDNRAPISSVSNGVDRNGRAARRLDAECRNHDLIALEIDRRDGGERL